MNWILGHIGAIGTAAAGGAGVVALAFREGISAFWRDWSARRAAERMRVPQGAPTPALSSSADSLVHELINVMREDIVANRQLLAKLVEGQTRQEERQISIAREIQETKDAALEARGYILNVRGGVRRLLDDKGLQA